MLTIINLYLRTTHIRILRVSRLPCASQLFSVEWVFTALSSLSLGWGRNLRRGRLLRMIASSITYARRRTIAAFFQHRVYRVLEFSTWVTFQNTRDLVITIRELEGRGWGGNELCIAMCRKIRCTRKVRRRTIISSHLECFSRYTDSHAH